MCNGSETSFKVHRVFVTECAIFDICNLLFVFKHKFNFFFFLSKTTIKYVNYRTLNASPIFDILRTFNEIV